MMPGDRAVVEGRLYQGTDEIISYSLTTTPWGSAPAAAARCPRKAATRGARRCGSGSSKCRWAETGPRPLDEAKRYIPRGRW